MLSRLSMRASGEASCGASSSSGERFQPDRLRHGRRGRGKRVGGRVKSGGQSTPGAAGERVQAGIRGDLVQPGAQRSAPLIGIQAFPGPQ